MIELKQKTEDYHGCLVCGDDLITFSKPRKMQCAFCGTIAEATSHCNQMHYVCDKCQHLSATEIVKSICMQSHKTDPVSLAVEIMRSPAIKMHGPEHHMIVPSVLLTCINNKYHTVQDLAAKIDLAEEIAMERAPVCSYDLNMCGAAIGTGVFLELYTGLNPEDEDEWSLPNQIIAKSLKIIAEKKGPRCCKRDTYISLLAAIDFLAEKFAIELPASEARCTFSNRNNSCMREDCDFYNIGYSLV
jgi:predicted RNA-binding Zn-ribbon protein involved in translation (DUF1610 family)